jgi:hypothetical protein
MAMRDNKTSQFVEKTIKELQPDLITHVKEVGVNGLTREFANKDELSCICTWLDKPAEEYFVGAVKEIIEIENPELGEVTDAVTNALIDACDQRHLINKAKANNNIAWGAGIVLGLFAIGGLVVLTKRKA